jgi:hypothetical protein
VKLLNRRQERYVANAVIADPEDHTVMDHGGAVRSIQAANVDMPHDELEAIWSPAHLERLARTYWKYLSRISLGLIRVAYSESERAVLFVTRPFVLLRFHAPDYELSGDRGIVRWRIRNGILVAKRDQGHLEIDVRRCASDRPGFGRVHVEVEVSNFYPMLARPFRWFYANTQSRIHVIVTHGFLKSLARLELEESAVGRFALPEQTNGNGARPHDPPRSEEVTVGDTPWGVVAGIAGLAAMVGVLVGLSIRRR